MKKALLFLMLLGAGSGGTYWYYRTGGDVGPHFRTAPVQRGDLVVTISATGTVEPVEVVDVGAQVAGKIETFGTDTRTGKPIDFGSQIEQGTVLARIDETLYVSDVQAQQALVDQAAANRDRAKAELEQSKVQARQAERDWKRAQQIMAANASALAATDYDNYQAKHEMAQATLGVSLASIQQTEKAVALAQANLRRVQTNLGYCTIKSPVSGVIIDRRVNIGQTVVASLNAPSLFLIAKDLRNMQVWVAVNEADIGRIHPGQSVHFTVDAYPGLTFRGTVNKIRLNASMTQNVVTYTVEVNTDNSDGKLLPYLSATVKFEVSREQDALMVPNNALNWTPQSDLIAPDAPPADSASASQPEKHARKDRKRSDDQQPSSQPATEPATLTVRDTEASRAVPGPVDSTPPTHPTLADLKHRKRDKTTGHQGPTSQPFEPQIGTVWVVDGSFVRPIRVTIGGTDGTSTQISGSDVYEGMEVVIGQQVLAVAGDGTVNPFAPKFPGRGGGVGGGKSRRGM